MAADNTTTHPDDRAILAQLAAALEAADVDAAVRLACGSWLGGAQSARSTRPPSSGRRAASHR
jgi:hypothetical protein